MSAPNAPLHVEIKFEVEGFDADVKLELRRELAVLFGPSGAGKSLLLRTIAGLLAPAQGRILIDGKEIFDAATGTNVPPKERRIGYMPQQYALFPHMTVAKNIAYGLHAWSEHQKGERLDELMTMMRLEHLRDRYPDEISGGEQQRTALARALAPRPALLLMDEPFAALDEVLREHLRHELRQLQQTLQLPVMLVTHNLVEAYTLADRVIIFQAGRITQDALREVVFRQPATPEIARLMAMENIFPVVIDERLETQLKLDWWGRAVQLPGSYRFNRGDPITIGIRPEDIMIVRKVERPLRMEGDIFFEGRLIKDQARGFDHLLTFVIATPQQETAELIVRVAHPTYLRLGLEIDSERTLAIRPAAIHIFD